MLWDVYCQVVDNHGDIGVCWRLARDLARRGERVRLRIDDASALAWMAPGGAEGVTVLDWNDALVAGDVVVEAFGCRLPESAEAAIAQADRERGRQPAWVNLEYLTAEAFAARNHRLSSPVMAGPAKGLHKRFFYPGFTSETGGLLREAGLLEDRESFDPSGWLQARGIPAGDRLVSLFCYEPAALRALLDQLAASRRPTRLLVTSGRAAAAVRAAGGIGNGALKLHELPLMPQDDFDRLLWASDLNFVRGEDSLVRALWAGKPFVWQLYPQSDGAHRPKLEAFLAWLQPPAGWADVHRAWNGDAGSLPPVDEGQWGEPALAARARLALQEDLGTQLQRFVDEAFFP